MSRFRSPAHFGAGLAIAAIALTSVGAMAANGPGPGESTFVPITPVRILDTRTDLGLAGEFDARVPRDLQVTGQVPTATGSAVVVPAGATGVVLNATAVAPSASGFVSIRPADAPGTPTTSNLNVEAGRVVPNAVTVAVPTSGADAGKIEIFYDDGIGTGRSHILIDVVGYMTASGLIELDSRVTALETQRALTAEVSTAGEKVGPGRFTVQRPQTGFYLVTFDLAGLDWSDRQHAQVTSMCPGAIPSALESSRSATTVTFVVYQNNAAGTPVNCAFFLQIRDQQAF